MDGQKEQLTQRQAELNHSLAEKQLLAQTLSKLELKVATATERADQFRLEQQRSTEEIGRATQQLDITEQQLAESRDELRELEAAIRTLEDRLSTDRESAVQVEEQLQVQQLEVTQWEVEVAKSEQRVEALRRQRLQLEQDQRDREDLLQAASEELVRGQHRLREAELHVLQAQSQIAEQAWAEEACASEIMRISQRREAILEQRAGHNRQATKLRNRISEADNQRHAVQLESQRAQHQRDTLLSRLEEDYGVSVADLEGGLAADASLQREEIDREIDELRRKISNLARSIWTRSKI